MASMPISIPKLTSGSGQNITIGAASAQNASAFNAHTTIICINTNGDCHFETGQNPTALATSPLLKATDGPLLIGIGRGDKIAIIQDGTSTGTVNVSEWSY